MAQHGIQKLAELIGHIDIAILTTLEDDNLLWSRPMVHHRHPFDGNLYFFTKRRSARVEQIEREHQVAVAFSDPEHKRFVSCAGQAELLSDQKMMEELWTPSVKSFFPDELDDPDLSPLKVEVRNAEYWIEGSPAAIQPIGIARSMITGKPYEPGENEKVQVRE